MTPTAAVPAAVPAFDVLVFEHVPKTAGTTLRQLLRRRYGDDLYVHFSVADPHARLDYLAGLTASDAPPKALIATLGYGFHERLPAARPLRYAHVTLLREPIQRTVSHYYYSLQIGEVAEGTSLAAFCSGDPTAFDATRAANRQTAFLASRAWNYQTAFLSGLRVEQLLDGRPFDPADYDEALLERAKRNLDTFLAVGLAERFDESILLLGRTLGWPLHALRFVSKNEGKRRPKALDLASADRAALEAANRLDAALYAHAERRFEALLAERVPDVARRRATLGRINRLYAPLAPFERRLRQLVSPATARADAEPVAPLPRPRP